MGILEEIGSSEKQAAPEVQAMAKAAPLLREILRAASPDGDIAQGAAELASSYPKSPLAPRSYKWVVPVVAVVFLLLCAGGLSWSISDGIAKRRAREEAQDKYVAPFVARLAEFTPQAPEPDLQPPYRRGKVIPINVAARKGVDGILLDFPEALRPNAPDDVGTIVWLKWGEQAFGKYSDGMLATVITCRVTVIDKSKNTIIAEQDFVGGPPPQKRQHLEPCTGASPAGEIIGWLANMPAR
jgi:hypothetical protein